MKLIERYIAREILLPFTVVLLILVGLYASFVSARLLTGAVTETLGVAALLKLVFLKTLIALEVLIPIALYLSVIIGLERLNKDQELNIIRSIGVSGTRIVGRELLGDLHCSIPTETSLLVELRQFLEFFLGHLGKLAALLRDKRSLAVALAADRHVLAEGHRDRATHEARDTCEQEGRRIRRGASDTDHERGDGDDAVVGTENTGSQPVELLADAGRVRFVGVCRVCHAAQSTTRHDGAQ